MKILQVSPYFYPFIGGQERCVQSLGRALVKLGHEVVVFTSNFPKGKKYEVIDGIKVYRFDMLSKPLGNPIIPGMLSSLIKKCGEFDVIHVHNEHSFASNICALVKTYFKMPLIVSCHGQLKFDSSFKDLIERIYSKTVGSLVFKKADRIIALSNLDKEYVSSLGIQPDKISVIPNGVDLSRYHNPMPLKLRDFDFEGKRVVLFVGPIIRRKGPHILIQAIPKIVKDFPDVVFLFVGEGNFKEEAEKLASILHVEKWTHFTGRISDLKLAQAYRRSDFFVLPSFSEGVPYSILDAYVFSKPVVSTLTPCIAEYLVNNALLIPTGDVDALASAIRLLLTDEKLAKKLSENGRRLVEMRFNWDVVVKRILQVYNEVIND